MQEVEILENKSTREKLLGNVSVLEKVKDLLLLGDSEFATTQQVADYYEVGLEAIKTLAVNNREELLNNGLKDLTGKETKEFLKNYSIQLANFKGYFTADGVRMSNRNNLLFPKKTILNVGMLLRDSTIADKIKQELCMSSSWNINLRKEIKFKNELNLSIKKIRQVMIDNIVSLPHTKIYPEIKQAIINLTTYKQQYNVCNNKYRIDYYFPLLNIAVEYDENYHNSKEQIEKDKQREYEIQRYFYINEYYKDITEDDLKEFHCNSLEELYDNEYNYSCEFCSSDLTKFIRVKEKNELEGLLELTTTLLYFSENEIKARGMSCNYKDLLILQ